MNNVASKQNFLISHVSALKKTIRVPQRRQMREYLEIHGKSRIGIHPGKKRYEYHSDAKWEKNQRS